MRPSICETRLARTTLWACTCCATPVDARFAGMAGWVRIELNCRPERASAVKMSRGNRGGRYAIDAEETAPAGVPARRARGSLPAQVPFGDGGAAWRGSAAAVAHRQRPVDRPGHLRAGARGHGPDRRRGHLAVPAD